MSLPISFLFSSRIPSFTDSFILIDSFIRYLSVSLTYANSFPLSCVSYSSAISWCISPYCTLSLLVTLISFIHLNYAFMLFHGFCPVYSFMKCSELNITKYHQKFLSGCRVISNLTLLFYSFSFSSVSYNRLYFFFYLLTPDPTINSSVLLFTSVDS